MIGARKSHSSSRSAPPTIRVARSALRPVPSGRQKRKEQKKKERSPRHHSNRAVPSSNSGSAPAAEAPPAEGVRTIIPSDLVQTIVPDEFPPDAVQTVITADVLQPTDPESTCQVAKVTRMPYTAETIPIFGELGQGFTDSPGPLPEKEVHYSNELGAGRESAGNPALPAGEPADAAEADFSPTKAKTESSDEAITRPPTPLIVAKTAETPAPAASSSAAAASSSASEHFHPHQRDHHRRGNPASLSPRAVRNPFDGVDTLPRDDYHSGPVRPQPVGGGYSDRIGHGRRHRSADHHRRHHHQRFFRAIGALCTLLTRIPILCSVVFGFQPSHTRWFCAAPQHLHLSRPRPGAVTHIVDVVDGTAVVSGQIDSSPEQLGSGPGGPGPGPFGTSSHPLGRPHTASPRIRPLVLQTHRTVTCHGKSTFPFNHEWEPGDMSMHQLAAMESPITRHLVPLVDQFWTVLMVES